MDYKHLTLDQVARQCDRTPDTISRWISRGLRNTRLQVHYRGGSPCVRPEDLEAFFAAVTAARRLAPEVE
jgi:hypothetical protein